MSTGKDLPPALLVLTPGTLRGGRGFASTLSLMERAARAAFEAGIRGLMVREPHLEDGEMLALGASLGGALRGTSGGAASWLAIHDRVHLASALGADGVHLGRGSLPPREARRVLGDAPVVMGLSTHRGDDLSELEAVDYAFHGPVFAPRSKARGGGDPMGPEGLRSAAAGSASPLWALGGIDPAGIRSLGPRPVAAGVALIGALWGTGEDPLSAVAPGPLGDVAGIASRAAELIGAANDVFGSQEPKSD